MNPVKIAFLLFSVFLIPGEIFASESKLPRHGHRPPTNGKQGRTENTKVVPGSATKPLPLKQLREDLMEKYENRINRVRRDSSEEHLLPEASESESESGVPGTGGNGRSAAGSSTAYGAGSSAAYGAGSSGGSQGFGLLKRRNKPSNSAASGIYPSSYSYIVMILLVGLLVIPNVDIVVPT